MDGIAGIEATRRITAEHPEVRVILLSTYDAEDLPADARTCGAAALRPQGTVRPRRASSGWARAEPGLGFDATRPLGG